MEIISLLEDVKDLQGLKIVDILPNKEKDNTPFNVCHIIVSPNESTTEHKHDERESFLILKGEGYIKSGKMIQNVKTGDLIHFNAFESHSVTNTGSEPLSFLTIYWRDYITAFHSAINQDVELEGPVYVTSGPPTPNGDLHLGHLSGPFLGADVCTRFLKMKGKEVYNISWSDDFQSGVADKSEQLGIAPQDVADQMTEIIQKSLGALDIKIDIYLRPSHSQHYQEELSNFFHRLWQEGAFIQKATSEYFESDGKFLHEGMIRGYCPNCMEPCTGNLCEECGQPHSCKDVVDALSNRSKSKPIIQTLERIHLPLRKYTKTLKEHHEQSCMRTRLRVLFDQFIEKQLSDFPITYPSSWGVPVPIKSMSGHVISPWFEMAFAFLFAIRELERKKGANLNALSLPKEGKIVHFFGFDNSFYYTVLFPAIYLSAFPNEQLNIDYICNEFYSLDGAKFSTSRQHVVADHELLLTATSDEIRFYLAYTRPEVNRTNFTRDDFFQFIEKEFSKWKKWLLNLDSKLNKFFCGIVPEAGLWTNEQIAFYASMEHCLNQVTACYSIEAFSLQKATRLICSFVEDCDLFSEGEEYWRLSRDSNPQFRTSITLEVTAANLLAILVFPLMPQFAANLWKQLGNETDLTTIQWPKHPLFATPNVKVDLSDLQIVTTCMA